MAAFQAKRVSRRYVLSLAGKPDDVFPLFGPVREKEWAESWEMTPVYTETGVAEAGFVFTTRSHGAVEAVWVMTQYDTCTLDLEYLVVSPGLRVVQLHIHCEPDPNGHTLATVTRTITALSEHGNMSVDQFTEAAFRADMAVWEKAINHYLHTGEALRHHGGSH